MKKSLVSALLILVLGAATTACVPGDPFGAFDSAVTGDGSVTVNGWAIDDSAPMLSVDVRVFIDGQFAGTGRANVVRPDVQAQFPRFGAQRGYSVTVPIQVGTHRVCVAAMNIGTGKNNTELGCKSVEVADLSPKGNLEVVRADEIALTVAGWAIDPDSPDPVLISISVNDRQTWILTPADISRSDVGAVFPGTGNAHGFNVDIISEFNPSDRVCVTALNEGGGRDTDLGCFGQGSGRAIESTALARRAPFVQTTFSVAGGRESIRAQGFMLPSSAYNVDHWYTMQDLSGDIIESPDFTTSGSYDDVFDAPPSTVRVCLIVVERPGDFTATPRTARCAYATVFPL